MTGHAKILKKSFTSQLLHCLRHCRTHHKISYSRISAVTSIPENRIRAAERTGNMSWFELSSLLYFHHKWIKVTLVDENLYSQEEDDTSEPDGNIG